MGGPNKPQSQRQQNRGYSDGHQSLGLQSSDHLDKLRGITRASTAALQWPLVSGTDRAAALIVHAYQLIRQLDVDPGNAEIFLHIWNRQNDPPLPDANVSNQVRMTRDNVEPPPELVDPNVKGGRPLPESLEFYGASMPDVSWVWDGYFAKGYITQLVGATTVGKTTLLAYILQAMAGGPDDTTIRAIGPQLVLPGRALVLTEEDGRIWQRRAKELMPEPGLSQHVEFLHHSAMFTGRPTLAEWHDFCCWVAALVPLRKYDLVIIDPWQTFNPVADENDSLSNVTAVNYLKLIAQEGAAVVLSHHPSKSGSDYATAGRGTSATAGLADILMFMEHADKRQGSTKRRITANGRLGGTPPRIQIELTDRGYTLAVDPGASDHRIYGIPGTGSGTRNAARQRRLKAISRIVGQAAGSLKASEILQLWSKDRAEKDSRPPTIRTLYGDLAIHTGISTDPVSRQSSVKRYMLSPEEQETVKRTQISQKASSEPDTEPKPTFQAPTEAFPVSQPDTQNAQ